MAGTLLFRSPSPLTRAVRSVDLLDENSLANRGESTGQFSGRLLAPSGPRYAGRVSPFLDRPTRKQIVRLRPRSRRIWPPTAPTDRQRTSPGWSRNGRSRSISPCSIKPHGWHFLARRLHVQRNYWFALSEDRPLFFFAGLRTPWHGIGRLLGSSRRGRLVPFLPAPSLRSRVGDKPALHAVSFGAVLPGQRVGRIQV